MRIFSILLILFCTTSMAKTDKSCHGRFINPITDVCWSCLFPISIGAVKVVKGEIPDTKNPALPICVCKEPTWRMGITMGYWEPARLVDVTRHPYCLVSMGGKAVDLTDNIGTGSVNKPDEESHTSFYHLHWYVSPILYWFNLLTDAVCVEQSSFDIAYLTELDPTWNDDELAFILNPEASLFANTVSQASCALDCEAATNRLPNDAMRWCAGCQGSMFPLTGHVQAHTGGVMAGTLLTERMAFKLHREGLLLNTAGNKSICKPTISRKMKKSHYRYQMTFPEPATKQPDGCKPFGHQTYQWGKEKEFPVKGEDFGFLVWQKRNCCAF